MFRFNNDQLSAGVWLVFGVAISIASTRYGLGSLENPGTGFLPFLSGLLICLFSIFGMVESTIKQREEISCLPIEEGRNRGKVLLVLVALFAYASMLNWLGFIVCTAFFVGFLLKTVRPQRWYVIVVSSLLSALGAFGVFDLWLKAQLPKGPWGF
jgi:putative tricarboxylic transport membrane protein